MKKEGIKKYEQTITAELEEEQMFEAPSSIFDVNQYLKYENDKKNLFLIMLLLWGILLDLSF